MASPETKLRLILRAAELIARGDWLDVSGIEGSELVLAQYTGSFELRELSVLWLRDPTSSDPQDVAMCTFHLLNITAGAPDASWITADYTTCEARFDTWWTAIKPQYPPQTVLHEYVWRPDGPAFKPFGASLSPTLRRVAKAVAGTEVSGMQLPPQVAVTVTERTAAQYVAHDVEGVGEQTRKRWGRFYLPPPTHLSLSNGRVHSAFRSAVSAATTTLYNGLRTDGFIPVMYSPTTGNAWSVDELAIDDVYDVIRSRRFDTVLARTVTATAA